jgi:hypothetical protein
VKTVLSFLALFVLDGASGAFAQAVFKSTMPDGKIVYGEKPAPGATRVDKMDPPPAKTGVTGLTPEEKTRAEQQSKQRAATAAAAAQNDQRADELRKQLQQAEAARDAGKEPLATERIGIAGGGSRLTDEYFKRQKALDDAVAAARKRLGESPR